MKRLLIYIALLLAALFWQAASAQKLTVMAMPDTNVILIGQQFKVMLSARAAIGEGVKFPQLKDTINSHIEIINVSKIDTAYSEDKSEVTLKQSLVITSFDSGYWAIPPFRFCMISDSNVCEETEAFLIQVNTLAIDTTKEVKDIKAPMDMPLTWQEVIPYIIGGIAGIALIVLLIVIIRRYIKKREQVIVETPVIKIKPHIKALEALADIERQHLWQNGRVKEYHILLADAIRLYIEERFEIPALEQTTDEVLHSVRTIFKEEEKLKLKQLLVLSDLVKFAKEQPLPAENEQSLRNAFDFVNITKPYEPTNVEPENNAG